MRHREKYSPPRLDRGLEIALSLVLIFSVLAFGAVQPLAYSLQQAAVFLLLFLLLLRQIRDGSILLPLPLWPFVFVFVVVVQLVPLPPAAFDFLSPLRLGDSAVGIGEGGSWLTISVYPHLTLVGLVKFLAYLAGFVLAAYLFDSRRGRSLLLGSLVLVGTLEAVIISVEYLTGWWHVFGFLERYKTTLTVGTYINRNHFAGLIELTLPFAFAAGFYRYEIWKDLRGSRRLTGNAAPSAFQVVFYIFLCLLMGLAVLFSASRAGILAVFVSFFLIALLSQARVAQKMWGIGLIAFIVALMGYAVWIGLDPTLERFRRIGEPEYLHAEGRMVIWKDTLQVIRHAPLLGTGLGTFGISFRPFQTSMVNFYVDHAHNDYLQFAVETGIIGMLSLFVPIFILFVLLVRSFLTDSRRYRRSVTLGCIGATAGLLLHTAADFNLQIPANALVFAIVLGVGYKAAVVERRRESSESTAA